MNKPSHKEATLTNSELISGAIYKLGPIVLLSGFAISAAIGSAYEASQGSEESKNKIIDKIESRGTKIPSPTSEFILEDGTRVEIGDWARVSTVAIGQDDLDALGDSILRQDELGAAYYDLSKAQDGNKLIVFPNGMLIPISSDSADDKGVVELRAPAYADTPEDLKERNLRVALDRSLSGDEAFVRLKVLSADSKTDSVLEVKFSSGEVPDANLVVTVTDR